VGRKLGIERGEGSTGGDATNILPRSRGGQLEYSGSFAGWRTDEAIPSLNGCDSETVSEKKTCRCRFS